MEKNPIRWTPLNIRIKEYCTTLGYRLVIEDGLVKLISVEDNDILIQFDNDIDNEWDSLELKIHHECQFLIKESEQNYSNVIKAKGHFLNQKYERIVDFYTRFCDG